MEAPSPLVTGEVPPSLRRRSIGAVPTALIEVVAEKTGYPAEVLDLDMQLDADLGIDSIKRVEILSALAGAASRSCRRSPPDQLGSFRTLRAIVEFLGQARPLRRRAGDGACRLVEADARPVRSRPRSCWRRSPRRPAIPSRCSSWTCGSTPTWASTRSSGSRSSRPSRSGFPDDAAGGSRADRDPRAPSARSSRSWPNREPVEPRSRPGSSDPTRELAHPRRPVRTTIDRPRCCWRRSRRRPGIPSRCSSSTCGSTPTWASTRSSESRSSRPCRTGCPRRGRSDPSRRGRSRRSAQIVEFLSRGPDPDPTPPPLRFKAEREWPRRRTAGRNGKATIGKPLLRAEPSRNGHGHAHGHPGVVLRRLEPRAVPLASSIARESVKLPAGGTIWITDDGSALTEALRHRPESSGVIACTVIAARRSHAARAGRATLCGLIVLAPTAIGPTATSSPDAFRMIRAAGPALRAVGAARWCGVPDRLAARWTLRRRSGSGAEIDPTSGALAGLAKTAGHEWPEVHCKAVDLDDGRRIAGTGRRLDRR